MRRLYLRDCQPGDVIEDVYVITNKQLSATATGKHFIKAFLSDRTAQVTARMWNANKEIFGAIPDGGFLRIRGRVENYQNNLQLIIEQLWPAKEGAFDVGDLMPHTERDIDGMCQRLFEVCQSIQNRHLAALVQAYLDDEELMNNFCRAPAAMNFHHAFVGGLLEHTLNAMEVGDAVCRFYPALNRDLVVSGIFLHDIAKTWELTYDCAFGYTDGGQLVGHIVKAAIWVEQKAATAERMLGEKIPQSLVDVVQHIILSHHGLPEFGAARTPSTPEAIAVHTIENLDAKLMMALGVTRGKAMAGGEGNWTEYLKAFNGRLYRPDVAPAEAVEVERAASDEAAGDGRDDDRAAIAGSIAPQPQQPSRNPMANRTVPPAQQPQQQQPHRPQPAPQQQHQEPRPQTAPAAAPPRQSMPAQPSAPAGNGSHAREQHSPTGAPAAGGNGAAEPKQPSGPGQKLAITNPLFETTPSRKK